MSRPVRIVDIGASNVDGPPVYQPLLDRKLAHVIAFDPQTELVDRGEGIEVRDEVLWSRPEPVTMRFCRAPGMSGVLPLAETAAHFPMLEEWGEVTSTSTMDATTLDDADVGDVDFIKIDAQGAEGPIIQGGHRAFDAATVVQLELAMVTFYEGQWDWHDVVSVLDGAGFALHTIAHSRVRPWIEPGGQASHPAKQLFEIDAVFVRPPTLWADLTAGKLRRMAAVLRYVYGSHGLAELADVEALRRDVAS